MFDRFKFKGYWYNDTLKEWRVYDEPEFITGDGTAEIWSNSEGGAYPELPSDAELHLCQCTGLKDKNGKLIYEGDIVKFKDQIKINGSKTHISVVEFNEQFNTYMYHAECMGLYTVNKAQNEKFDVEVIGNIYENKSLLESEA